MLAMNVFTQDAFSAIELTLAVDRMGFTPGLLGSIPGLYVPVPVRTEAIWIEERGFAPALIQTSPRGAPPKQVSGDKRTARSFRTLRLAEASRITASELQSIRAFGSETELKSLQLEIARRFMKIKQNFALTKEYWLLAMVQGKVIDADGTVLYDWSAEFSQAQPAEVPFNFAGAAVGSIRTASNNIARAMLRNLKGLGGTGVRIMALCGDSFFDQLVTSTEVRQTYLNWLAAAELRDGMGAFSAFPYGDILWINYRGTDDNTTVAIASDRAKFFPVGAGIFQWALSPAEQFEFVNTPGREMYAWTVPDRDRDMWIDLEGATYPLPVCVQPSALASGRAGA